MVGCDVDTSHVMATLIVVGRDDADAELNQPMASNSGVLYNLLTKLSRIYPPRLASSAGPDSHTIRSNYEGEGLSIEAET